MKAVQSPHDTFFRKTFGQPEHAKAFLKGMLSPALLKMLPLADIEITKDSYVDEELQLSYSDLVIKTNFQLQEDQEPLPGYLYMLFEHKSYPDPLVALQLNGYLQRIWKDSLQEEGKPKNTLPVILPMVIYHGKKAWNIPRQFQALVPGAKEAALGPYTPHWEYQLYDLSRYTDEQIRETVQDGIFQNVLMVLRDVWTPDITVINKHLMEAAKAVWTLGQQHHPTEYLQTLILYLWEVRDDLPKENIRKILHQVDPERSEEVMTIAEQLRQEGRQEGRQEERVELLILQLTTKFGPLPEELERKIHLLEGQKLKLLIAHIFDYKNLEDVKERLH